MRIHTLLGLSLAASLSFACGGDDDDNDDGGDNTAADASTNNNDEADASAGAIPCDEVTQECCLSGEGGQSCIALEEPSACGGTVFGCDGPEDCNMESGETCCGMGDGAHCEMVAECVQVVCHEDTDCGEEGAKCCQVGNDMVSRCLAEEALPPSGNCPGGGQ
jgi:hypothetical protein